MVKVHDAEDPEELPKEGSDDDAEGLPTDGGDDVVVEGVAAGPEPLFWPAVRYLAGGGSDCKHVLVYGNQFKEAAGDDHSCTRIPVDMCDQWGDYRLVPDLEVKKLYRAKKQKEEALFWPARRMVDGKDEYKHVRVHDVERTCGDCKRYKQRETRTVAPACSCHDCERHEHHKNGLPFSSRNPFNPLDLLASDGLEKFCLLPDHEVLSLYFHDETTAKENDDGACQWMSKAKGAAIKKKGEGRSAHVSDIVGVDRGVAVIGKEAWGMMQEDKNVEVTTSIQIERLPGQATSGGGVPMHGVFPQTYGRSGIYFGRQEGDGESGLVVKKVQDAVELLKGVPAACQVTKTKNDPSTSAVVMTVGVNQDGYWTCDRMCEQIPALIAIHELTSEPHRQLVMVFDNSTGHAAYESGALLANHVQLRPGGEQTILADFEDDEGNRVHTTFRVGDKLLWSTNVYAPKTPEQLAAEQEAAEKNPRAKKSKHGQKLGEFKAGEVVEATGPTSKLIGLAKGGQQLLMEMALWKMAGKPTLRVLQCNTCNMERAATRKAITAFNRGGEGRQQALDDAGRRDEEDGGARHSGGDGAQGGAAGNGTGKRERCCATRVFAELKAFKEELNKVEKIFKRAGHLCIFLPRYHPELNAIERYWGYIKYLLRVYCEYSLPHMLKLIPGALSGVPLGFIRAWSRVTWLYLEAYDDGLVDYLECRDLKAWMTHRSSTDMGDAVVLARGKGKTEEEKQAAEAKALAAAQETRTKSMKRTAAVFEAWKRKVASRKEALQRLVLRRAMNAWKQNSL